MENYFKDLHLQQDPFPLTFTPGEYYETPELRRNLDDITQRLLNTSEVVLVTAPPGSGKSTLARRLKTTGVEGAAINLVAVDTTLSIEFLAYELVQQIFSDRKIDRSQAVSSLHKYLEYSVTKGLKPIIIIDNAESLPVATLHFLLQLAELRYREFSLHFLLLADESIEEKLSGDQFTSLTITLCREVRIPVFTIEQTRAYIAQRLQRCGAVRTLFTSKEMDVIHEQSQGLPGRIHAQARQLLIAYSEKRGDDKSNKYPLLTGLAASGVVIILLLAYFLHVRDYTPQATGPDTSVDEVTQGDAARVPADAEAETEVMEEGGEAASEGYPVPTEPVVEESSVVTPVPVADETESQPAIPSEPAPIENKPEGPDASDQVRMAHLYHLAEIPEYLAGIRGAEWLRAQPPDAYCLQLISAQLLSNIEKLLREEPGRNGDLSGYIKYTPSGKPRYLLFYGIYPDKETAANAVAGIPSGFAKVKPWPQKIAVIVRDLDQVEQRIREEGIPEEGDSPVN